MRIPVGRIIRTDMGDDRWGRVVYMVANPPIECRRCGIVIFDWRHDAGGGTICPSCGVRITDFDHYPCPRCGGDDYHTLRVVVNNNWHYDSESGIVVEYNDKNGRLLNVCGKSLLDDIKYGRVCLLTPAESQEMKRRIVWTGSDDYDPEKPMPQEIIDNFPYYAQE